MLGGGNVRDNDDYEFPRGPPRRAEYKASGVSLDALRDPTVRGVRPCSPPMVTRSTHSFEARQWSRVVALLFLTESPHGRGSTFWG